MTTIFVSHSSRDDALASQLEAWLKENGFTDLFIDHRTIRAGDKWAQALHQNAGACRVVVSLVTENWLLSSECFPEFRTGWLMGKRTIPLFLLAPGNVRNEDAASRLARVMAEDQGVDLTPFITPEGRLDFSRDEALADVLKSGLRAAGALTAVGLDPAAFAIDRARRPSPFPGLTSFGDEDADAALFFGRSREIADTLEMLRRMRATSEPNPLVILGASGSGKSSLMKAGIIPRLRREVPAWIVLRAFRPGADPLLNFAEAITKTLADFGETQAHGILKQTLLTAWHDARAKGDTVKNDALKPDCTKEQRAEADALGEAAFRAALGEALQVQEARLRLRANRPAATILISIDQAEELARSDGESGSALADYLRAAMDAPSSWRLAFTIRTDSFPELQAHNRFQGLEARGYDLRTLPVFRFDDVAEDPAARYDVKVDPELTDALMEDAPGKDALPLLAFALQRLWDQFALSRQLTLAAYKSMGGLPGLIENAAERALCGIDPEQRDAALPAGGPRAHQIELGRAVFVPALADVNDEGAAIRRVAGWKDFSEPQQELLDRFGRWRLVVRREGNGAGATIEVAHEALFREWGRLRDWLEPERARLEALRALKLATLAWVRHQSQSEFLTHFGERLKAASALERHDRFSPQLSDGDKAYLAAARKAEGRSRTRRRILTTTAALLGVSVVIGSLGYAFEFELKREWARQVDYARYALAPATLAELEAGNTFRECARRGLCPEMVVIPGGEFIMGSPEDEPGRFSDEGPQREVSIGRLAVGKFEITHEEWAQCVALTDPSALRVDGPETPVTGCAPLSDAGFGSGSYPAINLSWHDTQGYIRWLNQMVAGSAETGPYRLLTEAEWEYAARAGSQAAYSWGDDTSEICTYANVANSDTLDKYSLSWDGADCRGNFLETSPAGSFQPNRFGLFDMHGNVSEWTQDCYVESYVGAPVDGSGRIVSTCSRRVVRGGSWGDDPQYLRSAGRGGVGTSFRYYGVGFRVARTL
jgi:formylglycine-generating enzyme required for sulfatase activity